MAHKDPEVKKRKARENYLKNKEAYKARAAEWKAANPEVLKLSRRKNLLKGKYGLSWEAFLKKFDDQKGQCAICQCDLHLWHEITAKQPFVDHCHTTGKVRDLLCQQCNVGIGVFKENIENLRRAEEYLKKWQD